MTHHDLDLSIRFPFIISFTPVSSPSFVLITINPRPWTYGLDQSIFTIRFIVWIDSALAPGEASPRLSLIYLHILPHSRLVYQRAIVLPIRTRTHSPVSLSPRVASPYMPHSYALYPMTHPFVMTHLLLLPLRYWPLPPCDL